MKILVVSHYFSPHRGGIEIVAQNQAKALSELGQKVTILTSACGTYAGTTQSTDGYIVQRIPAWNYFEKAFGVPFPIFSPGLLWQSYKAVRQSDVVHIHDAFYMSSFWATLWAKLLGKPVVLTQHVALVPHPNKLVRLLQHLVYRTTGKFIFTSSACIAVLNSTVRDFLVSLGVPAEKIFLLPNGVDTQLFRPRSRSPAALRKKYDLPKDVPIALFVGRFVPKKGFDILLQSQADAYCLAFAGGEIPAGVQSSGRIVFLGCRAPAELAELYQACDMFVLPSQGEGFPLTIQEAMASGLPIITTDDPGYDLYNFDRRFMSFIQPSPNAITKELTELATNIKRRKAMATYSYEFAKANFDWHVNSQALLAAYRELI